MRFFVKRCTHYPAIWICRKVNSCRNRVGPWWCCILHVTPDRIGGIYWKDASMFEPDLASLQNFSLACVRGLAAADASRGSVVMQSSEVSFCRGTFYSTATGVCHRAHHKLPLRWCTELTRAQHV
jgi:hypothetical protein